jgi:hypothetical protein
MNIKTNQKDIFFNELKKSNVTLQEFCVQKNLVNYAKLHNILKKIFWHKKLECDEELVVLIIENWLTDKKNERAHRQIIDVKEIQLKFKENKQKDNILNMIKNKMSIDSKKIKALVMGRKLFEDLTDDQFQVLNLIKGFFDVQNTLNTWASGDKECQKSENQINELETEKKK